MNEILNSEQTAATDAAITVQVAPFGEFRGILRGGKKPRKVTQVLDAAAFGRIIEAWNAAGAPELLVDADHDSANGGATKAYAWASNLRPESDGLYADFRFTDCGAAAVNAREYRFVSPVFECDGKGGIMALTSIALTNRPNLPVSCVLNSSETVESTVEDNKVTQMEKILAALGLGPDASEEDAVAAIEALKTAKGEAEAEVLNREAEACAEANKDRIENRDEFIKLYVANGKETAQAFLAAMKAPDTGTKDGAVKQTILNAEETGKKPTILNAREQMAALPPRERAAFFKDHKTDF